MNLLTPETGEGGTLVRPIDRSDYPRLFELDRAVYPTASPVTEDVVDQWYRRNREFGMIFPGEAPGSISGLFIVIPLSQEPARLSLFAQLSCVTIVAYGSHNHNPSYRRTRFLAR